MTILKLLLPLLLIQSYFTAPEEDKVTSLPDYSYDGILYSGYLNVSATKKYHYVFSFSKEEPDKKPLVVWFNGGPGCSSLDGWANEHGPMFLDKNGSFVLNEYSWVKEANIIYIESPGDVGFSYINSTAEEDLRTDDNTTARDNLNALIDFFEKFPELRQKDFYITGESYAGIYVPILAYRVLEYNEKVTKEKKINLKGIAVGNGVSDWKYDHENATMDFLFTHHLISYEHRLDYVKYCLNNKTLNETKCKENRKEAREIIDGINIYDYISDCAIPKNSKGEISTKSKYYKYASWHFKDSKTTDEEIILNLKSEDDGRKATPCVDDTNIENYFSRPDVQTALHVKNLPKWYVCSDAVYNRYQFGFNIGSVWTYPTLIKNKLKILIYSGDTDALVPFNGNQLWIRDLKLNIIKPWRQWRVDNDTANVAGYVVKYDGLTFCTVKGTGHMAPYGKRKECHYMFKKYLNGEDL